MCNRLAPLRPRVVQVWLIWFGRWLQLCDLGVVLLLKCLQLLPRAIEACSQDLSDLMQQDMPRLGAVLAQVVLSQHSGVLFVSVGSTPVCVLQALWLSHVDRVYVWARGKANHRTGEQWHVWWCAACMCAPGTIVG